MASLIKLQKELAELRKLESDSAAKANVGISHFPSEAINVILIVLSKVDAILKKNGLAKNIQLIYQGISLIRQLLKFRNKTDQKPITVNPGLYTVKILSGEKEEVFTARIIPTNEHIIIIKE